MAARRLISWRQRRLAFSAGFLVLALAVLGLLRAWYATAADPVPVSWNEFLAKGERGQIQEALIGATRIVAVLNEPRAGGQPAPRVVAERLPRAEDMLWIERLRQNGVILRGQSREPLPWARPVLRWCLPIALLAAAYALGLRKLRGSTGPLLLGGGRFQIEDRRAAGSVPLAALAGVDEAKSELVEWVQALKHPDSYQRLGAKPAGALLLSGAPGTGKTSLVHAVACDADLPLFSLSGSQFVQTFLVERSARVPELFERIRERAPCLLFIDDLEIIQRAGTNAQLEREAVLEQLLLELERLGPGVGVVAATSEAAGLDEAWRRPGRFERRIILLPPGAAAREAIARTLSGRLRCAPDVDFHSLAKRTAGLVGADLLRLLNEAGCTAARRRAPAVTPRDLDAALDVLWREERGRGRLRSDAEPLHPASRLAQPEKLTATS
ncbi:MAG TPA: AAA family ATPase [Polyangiaceae bacterium]|nr:AAA family ATPase [Polyangiaceae bacterium]